MVERRQAAVREGFTKIKERAMGSAESSVDAASSVAQGTRHVADGNPLAMGLVAFGAGLVAATLFPATGTERDLAERAQPTLEKAAAEAGPAARHVVDELKPAAQGAVTDLRETAMDAVSNVKEQAADAASDTKSELQRNV